MRKASLFKKLNDNFVQCLACAWYCKIAPGKTGICGVRQNIGGELFLLVYGSAAAINIDPVEKKPLFHFLPGTKIFSLGTLGCNFGCGFCQNWDISQSSKTSKIEKTGCNLPPEKIIEYCIKNKIPSIAYTYNEPAIFFEYAYDTAILARKNGVKNVMVSNGYSSAEAIEKWRGTLDAINIDLKSFREEFYQKNCKARLEPVLENIKKFREIGVWVEVTTLIIPGENDSKEELTAVAKFIKSVSPSIPWHISRFHPDYKMREKDSTSEEKLLEAYEIGKKTGLKYVYLGNVFDEEHESTYCPSCGSRLIKRRGMGAMIENLKNGACAKCGEKIEGIWEFTLSKR